MENQLLLPTNYGKKAMEEELIRGRDMANQLLEVLTFDDKSNIREVKGSNIVAEDLVLEVLKSLTNTLLMLNNGKESNDMAVPTTPTTIRDFSFSSNCPKMEEDLDRGYKKFETLNTKNPKGSNKRKSSAPTWEKTASILIDDGHTWRKYGQKMLTNAKYFRNYYRCAHMYDQHCEAIKHVQRIQENPPLYRTTYYDHHTCKSSYHSDIKLESILCYDDSSILLSFDNNISSEQEFPFRPRPPSPQLPLLASTKEEPKEEIHNDRFPRDQLLPSENLQLCDFDVYFDYLRDVSELSSIESF
ncbi:putative transcription factor WRKY family [Medicago truncatula]|uniref:Putative transcription factor WRKY family n=1 Tax=Medicago truncatula TaxID=3880 RepID=G7IR30_MEDTR|nr:WRKY DNA-binding transcription factor 70 [Medicago truncatula]AES66551.1 WRKY DNA-binding domain protein [Medicago truncatula]RHN74903.1 putative transcription factor WRKY family [Medicago truncatula]